FEGFDRIIRAGGDFRQRSRDNSTPLFCYSRFGGDGLRSQELLLRVAHLRAVELSVDVLVHTFRILSAGLRIRLSDKPQTRSAEEDTLKYNLNIKIITLLSSPISSPDMRRTAKGAIRVELDQRQGIRCPGLICALLLAGVDCTDLDVSPLKYLAPVLLDLFKG